MTVENTTKLEETYEEQMKSEDIIAWAFAGHGEAGKLNIDEDNNQTYGYIQLRNHRIAEMIVYACEAGQDPWEKNISKYGILYISEKSFRANKDWRSLPRRWRK